MERNFKIYLAAARVNAEKHKKKLRIIQKKENKLYLIGKMEKQRLTLLIYWHFVVGMVFRLIVLN